MNKWGHRARSALGILAFNGALVICWSAAYFIIFRIYHALGSRPSDFVGHILSAWSGFFIFGMIMLIVGKVSHPKRMAYFQSIIDAMRQIAKGNFNIKLRKGKHGGPHNPFGELIDSINDMAEELSEMERMRQEFISNVSHEIQSPLTSIRGFARALRTNGIDSAERLHYLDIIETESMRLSKLSENLLKLTSLESEHHPFEPKRYRLDQQLRKIILLCEPQWVDKELDMDVSLAEVNIVADEDLMSQVWVNLINNSIKFTPQGGTVGVHLLLRGETAQVCVADTGIGISEAAQPHIFDRFYKADKSRNRAGGGSGLGLSIVKKIVDMHKGSIVVESQANHGTSMTVRLPAASD